MGKLIRQPTVVAVHTLQRSSTELFTDEQQIDLASQAKTDTIDFVVPVPETQAVLPTMEQIEAISEQARQEAYTEGHNQGYADGHKKGAQQGEQTVLDKWQPKQEQLTALIVSLTKERENAIERVTDEFVPVVFSALCKIVGDLALEPDFVCAAVRQALQKVRSTEHITIKVHSSDVEFLRVDELLSAQQSRISVVADDTIHTGCVIETSCGNIDARLNTQLTRLKNVLSEMRLT